MIREPGVGVYRPRLAHILNKSHFRKEAAAMAPQAAQDNRNDAWWISRCFEGDKSPEELLRALIQAHSK